MLLHFLVEAWYRAFMCLTFRHTTESCATGWATSINKTILGRVMLGPKAGPSSRAPRYEEFVSHRSDEHLIQWMH